MKDEGEKGSRSDGGPEGKSADWMSMLAKGSEAGRVTVRVVGALVKKLKRDVGADEVPVVVVDWEIEAMDCLRP